MRDVQSLHIGVIHPNLFDQLGTLRLDALLYDGYVLLMVEMAA